MQEFVKNYLPDEELKILDLGSRVVSGQTIGSYRQLFGNAKWHYTGADVEEGENVDIVMPGGYKFPFEDGKFDIIISGQTIEHLEYPWVWFLEMARVLKQGGVCCIIAPAVFAQHRYPIDTYRYYPDGLKSLAKWSHLSVLEAFLKKSNVTGKNYVDCCLIAKKLQK